MQRLDAHSVTGYEYRTIDSIIYRKGKKTIEMLQAILAHLDIKIQQDFCIRCRVKFCIAQKSFTEILKIEYLAIKDDRVPPRLIRHRLCGMICSIDNR